MTPEAMPGMRLRSAGVVPPMVARAAASIRIPLSELPSASGPPGAARMKRRALRTPAVIPLPLSTVPSASVPPGVVPMTHPAIRTPIVLAPPDPGAPAATGGEVADDESPHDGVGRSDPQADTDRVGPVGTAEVHEE